MEPKLDQKPPKSSPDGGPKWGTPSVRGAKKSKENTNATKKRVALHNLPPLGAEKVANKAPTWAPKWSQDGPKIDAKMHHFFDASWNRFLGGFWWILGIKIEPS